MLRWYNLHTQLYNQAFKHKAIQKLQVSSILIQIQKPNKTSKPITMPIIIININTLTYKIGQLKYTKAKPQAIILLLNLVIVTHPLIILTSRALALNLQ